MKEGAQNEKPTNEMGERTGMQGKKKMKLEGFLQANDSVMFFACFARIAFCRGINEQLVCCSSSTERIF